MAEIRFHRPRPSPSFRGEIRSTEPFFQKKHLLLIHSQPSDWLLPNSGLGKEVISWIASVFRLRAFLRASRILSRCRNGRLWQILGSLSVGRAKSRLAHSKRSTDIGYVGYDDALPPRTHQSNSVSVSSNCEKVLLYSLLRTQEQGGPSETSSRWYRILFVHSKRSSHLSQHSPLLVSSQVHRGFSSARPRMWGSLSGTWGRVPTSQSGQGTCTDGGALGGTRSRG